MAQRTGDKRLPIYVTPDELQLIRVAAAYSEKSMAAFSKQHVLDAARRVIAEYTEPSNASHKPL